MHKPLQYLLGSLVLWPSFLLAQTNDNSFLTAHAQDFVALRNDKIVPFKADALLKAPYVIVYFGADWCPDCRRFSPEMVTAYDQQPSDAKRFEVLLISKDDKAEGMVQFMRREKMNWPALAFEKVATAEDLTKLYSEKGIPCLSVIDRTGKLIIQSKSDKDATEVLKQVQALLKKKN